MINFHDSMVVYETDTIDQEVSVSITGDLVVDADALVAAGNTNVLLEQGDFNLSQNWEDQGRNLLSDSRGTVVHLEDDHNQSFSQALVPVSPEYIQVVEVHNALQSTVNVPPEAGDPDDSPLQQRKDTGKSTSVHSIPRVDHEKMYQDNVSLRTNDIFEGKANGHQDDQTIATYASYSVKPKVKTTTIYEEDEDEESSQEVQVDEASLYGTESLVTGLMQRPGYRGGRKTFSREVEVSMDGFLHQVKSKSEGISDTSSFPNYEEFFNVNYHEDKSTKMSKLMQVATAISVLGLVATCSFFAANIGPFEVQPLITAAPAPGNDPNSGTSPPSPIGNGQGNRPAIDASTSPLDHAFLKWTIPYTGHNFELPILWTFPLSGGDILEETFGRCLGKVQAGNGMKFDVGGTNSNKWHEDSLSVVSLSGRRYVNVDLFSVNGIARATRLGFTSSHTADIAYSPLLHDIGKIFKPLKASDIPDVFGRLLVVFRDPMERAFNRYEQAKVTTGNKKMTLSQFANNPAYSENNPLTRGIMGLSPEDPLEKRDVEKAQRIIRDQMLVGLYDQFALSLKRFEQYFSWYAGGVATEIAICHQEVWNSFSPIYRVSEDYNLEDPVGFNVLLAQHLMDLSVYKSAKSLFDEQGPILFKAAG